LFDTAFFGTGFPRFELFLSGLYRTLCRTANQQPPTKSKPQNQHPVKTTKLASPPPPPGFQLNFVFNSNSDQHPTKSAPRQNYKISTPQYHLDFNSIYFLIATLHRYQNLVPLNAIYYTNNS
jgi:hypothetical protein